MWQNIFRRRVTRQDDLSPGTKQRALLSKLPPAWQKLGLLEETKVSTRNFQGEISGAPMQEKGGRTVRRQKHLPEVDCFCFMTNTIAFLWESADNQQSQVDDMDGQPYENTTLHRAPHRAQQRPPASPENTHPPKSPG